MKAESIGHQLRTIRKARGLTQKQLAAATGLDQSLLSKIERGDPGRRLSIGQVCELARVLKAQFTRDGQLRL